MDWVFQIYIFVFMISSILAISFTLLARYRLSTPGSRHLALLIMAIAVWTLSNIFETGVTGLENKIFWAKIQHLGAVWIGLLWLSFVLHFTHRKHWLTRLRLVLLSLIPLITIGLVFTNEWHRLIWTSSTLTPTFPYILMHQYGGWFWVILTYNYLNIAIGVWLLTRLARAGTQIYHRQALILLAAPVVPVLSSLIYLMGLSPIVGFDITPAGSMITCLICGWAIFRLGLFDLGAITHELLFENIGDGVVVLDKRNCLVSFNPAAQRYFKLSAQIQGHEFKLALSGEDHALSLALDTEAYQHAELVRPGPPPVYLDVRIFPLYRSDQQLIGRMIVTRDITTPKQFENALYLLNTELESIVRQRTAQLQNIVHNLEKEVNERRQAEASLRSLQETMAQRIADQSRKMAALYEVIMLYGQLMETDELVEQCLGEINAVVEATSVGLYQGGADEAGQLRLTAHWELSVTARYCLEILPPVWLPETKTPKIIAGLSRSEPALTGLELYLGTPIHIRTQVIGVLALFWAEPRTFSAEDLALFNILADQLGLILENDRLREIGREAAALHERQRLARELHDSVTQSLHSLTLLADTAVYVLPQQKPERMESLLHQLATSARQALKEMRLLLYHLQPTTDSKDLIELLTLRLDNVERRAGIDAQFTVSVQADWPSAWNEAIFRIAIEALNNALKHSRANTVLINLRSNNQEVVLEVTDNGCGFELERKRGGMGLQNMLDRAEQICGRLMIDSKPGRGTQVCLRIQQKDVLDIPEVEKTRG